MYFLLFKNHSFLVWWRVGGRAALILLRERAAAHVMFRCRECVFHGAILAFYDYFLIILICCLIWGVILFLAF